MELAFEAFEHNLMDEVKKYPDLANKLRELLNELKEKVRN